MKRPKARVIVVEDHSDPWLPWWGEGSVADEDLSPGIFVDRDWGSETGRMAGLTRECNELNSLSGTFEFINRNFASDRT